MTLLHSEFRSTTVNFWLHCEHLFELIIKEHTRMKKEEKKMTQKKEKNYADFRMSHQSTLLPELQTFVQKLSCLFFFCETYTSVGMQNYK